MTTHIKDVLGANSLLAQLPNQPGVLTPPNSTNRQLAGKLTPPEADAVMAAIADLVAPDSAYKPRYFKALYKMGPSAFLGFADRARKGRYPQHLFRVLLFGK